MEEEHKNSEEDIRENPTETDQSDIWERIKNRFDGVIAFSTGFATGTAEYLTEWDLSKYLNEHDYDPPVHTVFGYGLSEITWIGTEIAADYLRKVSEKTDGKVDRYMEKALDLISTKTAKVTAAAFSIGAFIYFKEYEYDVGPSTSDGLDYIAGGFLNTLKNLSTAPKDMENYEDSENV